MSLIVAGLAVLKWKWNGFVLLGIWHGMGWDGVGVRVRNWRDGGGSVSWSESESWAPSFCRLTCGFHSALRERSYYTNYPASILLRAKLIKARSNQLVYVWKLCNVVIFGLGWFSLVRPVQKYGGTGRNLRKLIHSRCSVMQIWFGMETLPISLNFIYCWVL